MEKEKAKTVKRKSLADKALDRYNELLRMREEIKKELLPLKRYLIQMEKIEKEVRKKKA
jgi:hypothetical protein